MASKNCLSVEEAAAARTTAAEEEAESCLADCLDGTAACCGLCHYCCRRKNRYWWRRGCDPAQQPKAGRSGDRSERDYSPDGKNWPSSIAAHKTMKTTTKKFVLA